MPQGGLQTASHLHIFDNHQYVPERDPGITAQPVAAAVSAVFRHEDMVSPAKKIIDIFQMLVGCFRITVGQDDNALRLVCKAAQIEDLFPCSRSQYFSVFLSAR